MRAWAGMLYVLEERWQSEQTDVDVYSSTSVALGEVVFCCSQGTPGSSSSSTSRYTAVGSVAPFAKSIPNAFQKLTLHPPALLCGST